MKISLKKTIKALLIIALIFCNSVVSQQAWCWTLPQNTTPGFRAKGGAGLNWGWCSNQEPSSRVIPYKAYVTTSTSPGSASNSPLCIQLRGNRSSFPTCATLKRDGFNLQGVEQEADHFTGPDVGEIKSILVRLQGSVPYKCKKVTIYHESREYNFQCPKKLHPCVNDPVSCFFEVNADGNNIYEIQVKTSNEAIPNPNVKVFITLMGSLGLSEEKLLVDDLIHPGETIVNQIGIKDIGNVKGAELSLVSEGKFIPTEIKIVSITTGQEKIIETESAHLENPGTNKVTYNEDGSLVDAPPDPNNPYDHSNGFNTEGISGNPEEEPNHGAFNENQQDHFDLMTPPDELSSRPEYGNNESYM